MCYNLQAGTNMPCPSALSVPRAHPGNSVSKDGKCSIMRPKVEREPDAHAQNQYANTAGSRCVETCFYISAAQFVVAMGEKHCPTVRGSAMSASML